MSAGKTSARAGLSLIASSLALRIAATPVSRENANGELFLGTDSDGLLGSDLLILREQGIATGTDGNWLVSWEDWPLAVELGARSLVDFSQPSHLLLELDRLSAIGREDFRYVIRWREGAREVEVERYGAYLRHAATGRVMHLDTRTLAIVEAVERYNALSAEQRRRPAEAWGTLGTVLANASEVGATLDQHLRTNVVIVPPSIGLTIRADETGKISFLPRLGGDDVREAFAVEFERALEVPEVVGVTLPGGLRARVLLTEPQREVLRRMRAVRRMSPDVARPLIDNPSSVFDGVGDAIDLTEISLEYGPRVIGVGPLPGVSNVRAGDGPSILQKLGIGEPDSGPRKAEDNALSTRPDEAGGSPKRTAVSIDVLEAQTGQTRNIRLEGDEEAQALLGKVEAALSAGAESVRFGDTELRVEPELLEVLRRHLSGPANTTAAPVDHGMVGRSGHLYLLINDHESSLTPSIEVAPLPSPVVPSSRDVIPAALDESIALKLHQQEGVRWLWTSREMSGRRGGVLADDMGLGKTLQVLVHIAGLIEDGKLHAHPEAGRNGPWRPVLIVAPLLLVESGVWTDEMRKCFRDEGRLFEPYVVLRDDGIRKVTHADGGRDLLGKAVLDPAKLMSHKVVITTYETMMAYQHSLAQRVAGRPMWSLVVFDEAQEIKSPATKQSYAAKAIDAAFKLAATGTPVETRLRDLWNLLDTVEDGRLGTQREFVAKYERPAMNAATTKQRQEALDSLREAISYERPGALVIRRDKSILTDLPPRIEHRIECQLTPIEESTMQRIRGALSTDDGRRKPLAALQQLHLCTQHPVLAGATVKSIAAIDLISTSSRMTAMIELLRKISSAGEKVLIFARSVDAQRLIARVITESLGIPVDIVNGQTGNTGNRTASGAVRREILRNFREQQGFGVIVLSPFVAGVGLTLTEANHVIHYGRWWNPAIENQATDRAHRIGQTKPVHVYYLIGVHQDREQASFDEVLDDLLRDRRELARDFLAPASEDANAEQLVKRLGGATGPRAGEAWVSSPTAAGVAAALISSARARGERGVWLGEDGMYGVHVLTANSHGVSAVRLVDHETPEELRIADAAAKTWATILQAPNVASRVVSRNTSAAGGDATWEHVLAEAVLTLGQGRLLSESVMTEVRSVSEILRALDKD